MPPNQTFSWLTNREMFIPSTIQDSLYIVFCYYFSCGTNTKKKFVNYWSFNIEENRNFHSPLFPKSRNRTLYKTWFLAPGIIQDSQVIYNHRCVRSRRWFYINFAQFYTTGRFSNLLHAIILVYFPVSEQN